MDGVDFPKVFMLLMRAKSQLEVPEDAGAKPHDSTAEKSQEQIA